MCVIFLKNKVLKMIIIIALSSTSFHFKIVMYFFHNFFKLGRTFILAVVMKTFDTLLINCYYYYMKYTTVQ